MKSTHLDYLRKNAIRLSETHVVPNSKEKWKDRKKELRQELAKKFHLFALNNSSKERIYWQTLEEKIRITSQQKWNQLDYQEHGKLTLNGYSIAKVSYSSSYGSRVTGNLYIPDGKGPFPAMLNLHGHWRQGKIAPRIQSIGHILAQKKVVVLTVDAAGAGERGGEERTWEYHGAAKAGALLLAGDTLMGMQVRDNIRAMDLLSALPFVDPQRIGVTGASGGGNQTAWLSALDDRVSTAIPVASMGSFEAYVTRRNCMCETLPAGLELLEQWELLSMIAPRPLLILNARYDQPAFGVPAVTATSKKVEQLYKLLESPDSFECRILEMKHGYHPPAVEAMLGWISFWLLQESNNSDPQTAPEWESIEPEQLLCYPKGERPNSVSYTKNREFILHNIEKTKNAGSKEELIKILNINLSSEITSLELKSRTHEDSTEASSLFPFLLDSPRGIELPGVSSRPINALSSNVTILLSPAGKQSLFVQDQWKVLRQTNSTLLSIDLPDTGELSWRDEPDTLGRFHDSARASLWLGYSLITEWTECLIGLCKALYKVNPKIQIEIVAEEETAFAALLTSALLHPSGIRVTEHNCPRSLTETDESSLAWYIPHFLEWGDLDDLRTLSRS